MLACSLVGTAVSFVLRILNPKILNKAGPDWLWMGGRQDVVRNLYFRPNGTYRPHARAALLLTFIAGSAALYWILQRITLLTDQSGHKRSSEILERHWYWDSPDRRGR